MLRLRTSIRFRLVVTFTLLTAIGGLILFLIASKRLQDTTFEFYIRDLDSEALIVSNSILSHLGGSEDESPGGQSGLRALLLQLRSRPDYKLVLFDSGLNVMADTGDITSPVLASSPPVEVAVAQTGNIGHDIRLDHSSQWIACVAVPVSSEDGSIQAILQIQAPLQPAYDLAQSENSQLAGIWLPVVLLSAIVSLWIGQSLARPIQQLNASALRIAGGALNERIQVESQDEIGQLGKSFNFMVERLNDLITSQRSFVSNAAHELRAPIMSLGLRIEAIRDETVQEGQKLIYLREAADEVKRMSEMVTSLLILARLDEGKHRTNTESFDTNLLLSDVARHWRIQAHQSSCSLLVDIPPGLPAPLISSSDMRIVLDNLLSNAFKYTSIGGEISIRASIEDNLLRLDVADSGEGFLSEEKERLFERFYRATRERDKIVSGTGLGLPIVREILQQYNGSVTAFSDGLGKGSTFIVRIPLN